MEWAARRAAKRAGSTVDWRAVLKAAPWVAKRVGPMVGERAVLKADEWDAKMAALKDWTAGQKVRM